MLQKYNTKPKYWEDAKRFLVKKDPVLSQIIQRVGNKDFLTRNSTPFQTLSNAIIGQQISVAAAASISQKLKNKIGSISPLKINKMSKVTMRNTGLSRQKIEYLKLLASCFINKAHFFYKLHEQSDDDDDQPEHFNEDNFANKLADRSPSNINNLASIDEEKGQRGGGGLQATNDQDEHEDISRSQSNSSKDSQKHILYMSFHNIAINSYSTPF